MLYETVHRYENTAGVLFISYAGYWIKQTIRRYLENTGRSIRLPVGMYQKLIQYKRFVSAFEIKALRKLRLSRITRQLEEKFEVNYSRAYYGSLISFRYRVTSIVEDIVIRNEEHELWYISKVM